MHQKRNDVLPHGTELGYFRGGFGKCGLVSAPLSLKKVSMETKNGLKIFNNPQFGDIRTAGTPDNPTFCLADICKALNLSASHVKERLSDDVVSTDPIVDSLGRKPPGYLHPLHL